MLQLIYIPLHVTPQRSTDSFEKINMRCQSHTVKMRCSTKKKALVKFASCKYVLGPAVFAELIVNMDVDMIACDRSLNLRST